MNDSPPRCPDCSVEMEEMKLATGTHYLQFMSDEEKEGILGSLGMKQRFDANVFVCSECGLSRIYADIDDQTAD